MITRREMLRWVAVTRVGVCVPVPFMKFAYSQPLLIDDLEELTAAHPILVSDDDSELVELYQRVLERIALLHTIGTTDARHTLQLSVEVPVSLVISDIMKPMMNGIEMLRQMRANPRTRDVPFLFVSACSNYNLRGEAKRLGADGYLVKPIFPRELFGEVRRLLLERYRKVIRN